MHKCCRTYPSLASVRGSFSSWLLRWDCQLAQPPLSCHLSTKTGLGPPSSFSHSPPNNHPDGSSFQYGMDLNWWHRLNVPNPIASPLNKVTFHVKGNIWSLRSCKPFIYASWTSSSAGTLNVGLLHLGKQNIPVGIMRPVLNPLLRLNSNWFPLKQLWALSLASQYYKISQPVGWNSC